MSERGEKNGPQFTPSAKLVDLYHFAYRVFPGSTELQQSNPWLQKIDRGSMKGWLERTWRGTKRINEDWVEDRFRSLRKDRQDWSIDGILVDEKGDIVGDSVWSTYNALRNNRFLQFEMHNLMQSIREKRRIIYPLSPKYETVLFWKMEDNERILEAITRYSGEYELDKYPATVGNFPISIARIRNGKLGTGMFAKEGIIAGKIGFWENNKLRMGNFGHGVYVQRVVFRDSSILPEEAYISPLDPEEVRERGGRLMEEKYPNVRVIRIDPIEAQEDFIASALAAESPIPGAPVVLSYTTPCVWLDEMPKHGLREDVSL